MLHLKDCTQPGVELHLLSFAQLNNRVAGVAIPEQVWDKVMASEMGDWVVLITRKAIYIIGSSTYRNYSHWFNIIT